MVTSDPLCVAWRLSLYGLRRGQALRLRWPDIDQRARMLAVNQVRLLIGYPARTTNRSTAAAKPPLRSTASWWPR
jgi:integrase